MKTITCQFFTINISSDVAVKPCFEVSLFARGFPMHGMSGDVGVITVRALNVHSGPYGTTVAVGKCLSDNREFAIKVKRPTTPKFPIRRRVVRVQAGKLNRRSKYVIESGSAAMHKIVDTFPPKPRW